MKVRGLACGRLFLLGASIAAALTLTPIRLVQAAPPVVSIGSNRARVQVVAASLSEIIDALSRAASFRVTYEGARPTAMLFNVEIDTPSVPQTLLRVLEGQNLNYGVVLDPSGRTVKSLLVLGTVPKAGAAPPAVSGTTRPQPFAPPNAPRNTLPPVDDEPEEAVEAEPAPPEPVSSPSPPEMRPGVPSAPFPPRLPFGVPPVAPFGPRPAPTPTPSPSA